MAKEGIPKGEKIEYVSIIDNREIRIVGLNGETDGKAG